MKLPHLKLVCAIASLPQVLLRHKGTSGSNDTDRLLPPSFIRPCIPKEIRYIYHTSPGSNYAVISWTEPTATDRDGDSPSVQQVEGAINGGHFIGGFRGQPHTIGYLATDKNGLTDYCFFTFTVIVPSCKELGIVKNGRYTCTNGIAPGSSCMFECHEGFIPSGSGNATCGYLPESGQFPIWKNVQQCERIECGHLRVPEHAKLTCTNNDRSYQTVCKINCHHGYSAVGPLYSICQANGDWSKSTRCISQVPKETQCSPSLCNHHPCMLNRNGSFSCKCSNGWSGLSCKTPPDLCVENICMNNAECINHNENYTCSCKSGYSGSLCQVPSVDGSWSDWSFWSTCTVSCGSGKRTRHRSCNNPPPDLHGKVCQGKKTDISECEKDKCKECPELNKINEYLSSRECKTNIVTGLETCSLSCKNGAIHNPWFREIQTVRCGRETGHYWVPGNVQASCVVPEKPSSLELHTEITYNMRITKEQQPEVEDQVKKNIDGTSCMQSGLCNTTINFFSTQVNDYTKTTLILTFQRYLKHTLQKRSLENVLQDLIKKAASDLDSTAEYLRNFTAIIFNVQTSAGKVEANVSSLLQQVVVKCYEGQIPAGRVCDGCEPLWDVLQFHESHYRFFHELQEIPMWFILA